MTILRACAHLLVRTSLLATSCSRNEPPKSNDAIRSGRVVQSAVPAHSTSSRASSEQPLQNQRDFCARLREGLLFTECNNPPRTKDYPDCRTFAFDQSDSACSSRELVLNITGYPGLAEKLRVQASTVDGSTTSVELTLVRTGTETRGRSFTVGTPVGMLELSTDKPAKLIIGKALGIYTDKESILEDATGAPPFPTAKDRADPIPLGNGDVVKGLD